MGSLVLNWLVVVMGIIAALLCITVRRVCDVPHYIATAYNLIIAGLVAFSGVHATLLIDKPWQAIPDVYLFPLGLLLLGSILLSLLRISEAREQVFRDLGQMAERIHDLAH